MQCTSFGLANVFDDELEIFNIGDEIIFITICLSKDIFGDLSGAGYLQEFPGSI